MGIPEQPQSGINIAQDGMVYEILEDGTIKRIGKVSPDGKFEPFGGTKDGIREKDGIIYRVINGKERKIGRILPNGKIETINQRIKIEAEVKAATIISVFSLIAFFIALYAMQPGGGTRIGSLYWSNRSQNKMNWNAAVKYCKDLDEGGYTGWRLPNIDELRGLIKNCSKTEIGGECRVSEKNSCLSYSQCGNGYRDGSCYCASINNNGGYYSKLGDDDKVWLWSSSTRSDYSYYAWYVSFNGGGVGSSHKTDNYYVRCVR